MNAKEFKPTYAMLQAAKAVLMAKAWRQTVEPIVTGYQREILNFYKWTNEGIFEKYELKYMKEHPARGKDGVHIITEPKHSYMLREDEFTLYMKECKAAQQKAGLKSKPECCPLLEAEGMEREAEKCLIDTMQPITGISHEAIWSGGKAIENHAKMIDLTLRLLTPFCKDIAA